MWHKRRTDEHGHPSSHAPGSRYYGAFLFLASPEDEMALSVRKSSHLLSGEHRFRWSKGGYNDEHLMKPIIDAHKQIDKIQTCKQISTPLSIACPNQRLKAEGVDMEWKMSKNLCSNSLAILSICTGTRGRCWSIAASLVTLGFYHGRRQGLNEFIGLSLRQIHPCRIFEEGLSSDGLQD